MAGLPPLVAVLLLTWTSSIAASLSPSHVAATVAYTPSDTTIIASIAALSGPVVQSLSSPNWSLTNANGSIAIDRNCSVPGSVFLDLHANGLLDDLFYRWNPINATWVSSDEPWWMYSRTFEVDAALLSMPRVELVLHGVDTIANVTVNGHYLGSTINQFRRWTYDVTSLLQQQSTLEVTILNAHAYSQSYRKRALRDYSYYTNGDATFVRKTQSDFGWDWGPAFVNMGLHQPVELLGYNDAMLSEMTVTQVFWEDASDALRRQYGLHQAGDVLLNVTAYVRRTAGEALDGKLSVDVALPTPISVTTPVSIPALSMADALDMDRLIPLSLPVLVPNNTYLLWWPNGYGAHPLYNITATLSVSSSAGAVSSSLQSRRIGFRRVFLRRLPIEGQPGRTMFFEVNGVPIFDKGSNLVPATAFHINESIITRRTLQSAVEAHQSIIRIWGGGVYEQDDAYDFADEAGLMMWQESIFANSFYPRLDDFLANVREETAQQVRRLVSHPSLAVWCGNNEIEGDILTGSGKDSINHDHSLIDYNRLFDDTIRGTLVNTVGLYEDGTPHLEYIMSSPANGPISLEPFTWQWGASRDLSYGDLHNYQYDVDCSVVSNFPQPRHLTEWGWQSYPSFITWQPVTAAEDWQLDSPLMQNRQHHPQGNIQQLAQIERHFHVPNATSPRQAFDDYVYVSQAVAALCYGTLMAFYRTLRDEAPAFTFGAMYWQLADQWQAPTWSSIEVGGRWKQNHNAVKRAFAPVIVTGHVNSTDKGDTLSVYVVSDLQMPLSVQWAVEIRQYSDGTVVRTTTNHSTVPKHYSQRVWFGMLDDAIGTSCDRIRCFVRLAANVTSDECNQPVSELEWFLFLAPLANVTLLDPVLAVDLVATTTASPSSPPSTASEWDSCSLLRTTPRPPSSAGRKQAGGLASSVWVNVSTAAVAAYVWLETLVPGRWSDNSMVLLPGRDRLIEFIAYEPFDADGFVDQLQIRSIRDTYTRQADSVEADNHQRNLKASARVD